MEFESYRYPSRRSNIIARNGLVATSQPLAAQAGIEILQAGGNAIDAAIAAAATLCVVEPCSTGVGGDAFALIWVAKEKKLYGLNASGPAPQALTAAAVRAAGHDAMPKLGGMAVTVPGALRGWETALDRFGSMGLDTLLQRPLHYARHGYPVSQRIARAWHRSTEKMGRQADSRRVWLPGGRAPRAAELFQNPEFAQTLQTIMENGIDAFYNGPIAAQIAAAVQADGGFLTAADLHAYQPEWVTPLSVSSGQYSFYEIPPNGQGLTALIALKLAQRFDLQQMGYGSVEYYHTLIEIMKLAFADAAQYIGDPRQTDLPIAGLLSDSYADERCRQIGSQAAAPEAGNPSPHGDTVYLSVADGEGNMVSWIQSLYMGFGSGLTAGTTGVQLQNRGANFVLTDGHPNQAAPGRRPYHTIIPGFITKNGEAWSSFGVMGGFMQPQGHLQVGLNLTQFGMDPQTALDAPRFNWMKGKEVAVETIAGAETTTALAAQGHTLAVDPAKIHFGGGQAIVRDPESGVLIGGSEPRNDGAAIGF